MKIEVYFKEIQNIIDSYAVIFLKNITFEKRGTYEGFIRGELYFLDGSKLHFREFIDTENEPDHLLYAYHYMNPSGQLIFRYDNTGHNKKSGLPTYPHHKHEGSEDNILPSELPALSYILEEIEQLLRLP